MANQDFIHKEVSSNQNFKIPFILAMVDGANKLVDLPFVPSPGLMTDDRIVGVELLVNPRTITSNQSKIINRTQTMTSFIEDHWGDELDTLSFQGQTATFVVGANPDNPSKANDLNSIRNYPGSPTNQFLSTNGQSDPNVNARSLLLNFSGVPMDPSDGMGVNDNEIGITTTRRRQSVSYRQFKRMIDLIRANGCTYDTLGILSDRYYIMLSYGSSAYRGYFENIDITEESTNPYKFVFTVTFKVEATVYSYVDRNLSKNVY